MVKDGDVDYYVDLNETEQQLAHEFDTRILKRKLDEAIEQKASKQQLYRGAGPETETTF